MFDFEKTEECIGFKLICIFFVFVGTENSIVPITSVVISGSKWYLVSENIFKLYK